MNGGSGDDLVGCVSFILISLNAVKMHSFAGISNDCDDLVGCVSFFFICFQCSKYIVFGNK